MFFDLLKYLLRRMSSSLNLNMADLEKLIEIEKEKKKMQNWPALSHPVDHSDQPQ